MWVDVDGDDVLLNSEITRAWPTNAEERRTVTVTVPNRENPYNYVAITGHLSSSTTDGAFDHGDRLAQKYLGKPKYPFHKDGDVRVLLCITPDRIERSG